MKDNGIIPSCSTSGCWNTLGKNRCCNFQQGNYIVLYPGELAEAQAKGQSIAHLEFTDVDYFGGQKVVCKAKNTATCDNGFKPLDCMSYPLFPAGNDGFWMKGKKCPLQFGHLDAHTKMVREAWNEVIARNPTVVEWLKKIALVGYTEPEKYDDGFTTTAITKPAEAA